MAREYDPVLSRGDRKNTAARLGRHGGVPVERRAPRLFGYLRNTVEQVASYYARLAP